MLYNSECWTLTKTISKKIDSFQRRLQCTNVLNVKWPCIMENTDVYQITNVFPLSGTIAKRCLRWYGHMLQLPESTLAHRAYEIAKMPTKKPCGKQKNYLDGMLKQQLQCKGLNIIEAKRLAQNRSEWRVFISNP